MGVGVGVYGYSRVEEKYSEGRKETVRLSGSGAGASQPRGNGRAGWGVGGGWRVASGGGGGGARLRGPARESCFSSGLLRPGKGRRMIACLFLQLFLFFSSSFSPEIRARVGDLIIALSVPAIDSWYQVVSLRVGYCSFLRTSLMTSVWPAGTQE